MNALRPARGWNAATSIAVEDWLKLPLLRKSRSDERWVRAALAHYRVKTGSLLAACECVRRSDCFD